MLFFSYIPILTISSWHSECMQNMSGFNTLGLQHSGPVSLLVWYMSGGSSTLWASQPSCVVERRVINTLPVSLLVWYMSGGSSGPVSLLVWYMSGGSSTLWASQPPRVVYERRIINTLGQSASSCGI